MTANQRTDRTARRITIGLMLAAALTLGLLAPGRADATTRHGETTGDRDGGQTLDRAAIRSGDDTQVLEEDDQSFVAIQPALDEAVLLADFTPEPPSNPPAPTTRATELDGAVLLAGDVDGLTTGATAAGPYDSIDDLMAGEGCSIQCITSGLAYPRGVGAHIRVTTHTETTMTVIVHRDGEAWIQSSGPGHIQYGFDFDELAPGQTYLVTASAEDADGHTSHAYGSFVTLERHVTVSMNQAVLTEHAYSSSLFNMTPFLDGQAIDGENHSGLAPEGDVVAWGLQQLSFASVDRHLDLQVGLDEVPTGGCIEASAGPFDYGPGNGQTNCRTWATVALPPWADDLDAHPTNADAWDEHTLQRTLVLVNPPGSALPADYGEPLVFTVAVQLDVTYS